LADRHTRILADRHTGIARHDQPPAAWPSTGLFAHQVPIRDEAEVALQSA
jgi:hypothetical protein